MFCKNAPINFVVIIFAKNLEVHSFKQRRHKRLSRQSIAGQIIAAWYMYGSLSKNGGIVVLYNFLAYVPSIFLFLCLQHLGALWVNKTEYYVMCPMTLFENST